MSAAGAALMLCASPCMAAEDFRDFGSGERRSAAFAGANLRLEMGRSVAVPTARLQLAMMHSYEDRQSPARNRKSGGRGLELGLTGFSKGALFLNGREAKPVQPKLGLGGGSTTFLIVGGVAVAVVGALLAFGAFDNDEEVIFP